jgi:hypothetical protein
MARIYDPNSKENNYNSSYTGSARSVAFNPIRAVDLRAREEKRARDREQNLNLEAKTLKRTQTIENTNLRQMQSAETAILKAEQAQQKAKLDTIKGLTELSNTFAQGVGDVLIKRAKEKEDLGQIEAAFGIGSDYASGQTPTIVGTTKQAEVNNAQSNIANEKGIQATTTNPVEQEAIRGAYNQQVSAFQLRRGSAYGLSAQAPAFFADFTTNTDRVFTRPDGSSFTVATIRDSADIALIDASARAAFYKGGGIKDLPTQQVLSSVIPTITSISSSWVTSANNKLIEGKNKARLQAAKVGVWEALAGNESIDVVFQNGAAERFASGNYLGDQGGANQDTVKEILDWAVRNNRDDVIESLALVEKVPGNKGTKLGKQYEVLFENAREGVIDEALGDSQRERDVDANQLIDVQRELKSALAAAKTPEEETQINTDFAERLRNLGSPEAALAGAKLAANPNYSPFTSLDIQQQMSQGIMPSNDELGDLVESGDITSEEAKGLGWDPEGVTSAGQDAMKEAKNYKSDTDAVARAAVTAALNQGSKMTADDLSIELQGNGGLIKNDISARLQRELAAKIAKGDLKEDSERRDWIARRGQQLAAEVTKDDNGNLQYKFGGNGIDQDDVINLQPTIKNPQSGKSVLDLRGRDVSELRTRADAAITSDLILSQREIAIAAGAIESGKQIPAEIEAKAQALGTNGQTLLRSQLGIYGMEMPIAGESPSAKYQSSSYKSSGDLSRYDTGSSYGGVSLDNLRNSVIGNESGGNYSAVNPDSGALGYGQVMPANVPSWSKAALGYTVSTRQFLANPEIQMKVINHRFESMMQDQIAAGYSGEELARRVASIWYSGQAGLWNNTRPQTYNGQSYPSISNYTLDIWKRYQGG